MLKKTLCIKKAGFTLVEIMIVVACIALLAAIAIPSLLRARLNANEATALSAIKTLSSAATSFRSTNSNYPTDISALTSVTPPYIDNVLGAGIKGGYAFNITGGTNTFTTTARPTGYRVTGVKGFFLDETGVVRWTDQEGEPTASDAVFQ